MLTSKPSVNSTLNGDGILDDNIEVIHERHPSKKFKKLKKRKGEIGSPEKD